MIVFVQENVVFILAITGAVITFLIFLIEKLIKKQKLKFLLIFAALGFLAITGRQIIEHIEKKNKDLLEQKKVEIVSEILNNTRTTLTLVEQLSEELSDVSPEKIGIELVQSTNHDELYQFFKGTRSLWQRYSMWLESFKPQENKVPCLSFIINANNHYNLNLILAYLYTNAKTGSYISNVMSNEWWSFPDSYFIDQFGIPDLKIKYALFYDGVSKKLIGYADANLLSKELLLFLKTGKKDLVENILNRRDSNFLLNMSKYFRSFKSDVTEKKDAYLTAKEMLDRKINELVVVYEEKVYLVNLSNIVKVVT